MITSLTLIQYKKRYIPFAFFAMAIFHLSLIFRNTISFYKLMGTGRNGTFDKVPDLQQWAILAVHTLPTQEANSIDVANLYGKFIRKWFSVFGCEIFTFLLEPVKGHGTWDKKKPFQYSTQGFQPDEKIATLTRATIRLNKLKYFWQNVAAAANSMVESKGFIFSAGVGEIPWIKQATFSIWESEAAMSAFAYGTMSHATIVKKTRKEKWYSEDMFVRFRILQHTGTIKGIDPLQGKL